LTSTPKNQAFSTVFDPPHLHDRDATEPHIRQNVYLADSLQREPSRIVRGQPEQRVSWPKHGDAPSSHGTFLPSRCNPVRFITGHMINQSREIYYRSHDPNQSREIYYRSHDRLRALQSREIYYRSHDHPNAHELTNHILHPSPAPGQRSPGAPGKVLRMRCGIVPVSPTDTTKSLPRIL
jgi:hypothetical protein